MVAQGGYGPEVLGYLSAMRRTEARDELAVLRDQLEPDDRTLPILRVDRKLG